MHALVISFTEVGRGRPGVMWRNMEILWGLCIKWESFEEGGEWGLATQVYLTPEKKNTGTSGKVRDWEQVVF